MEILAENLIIQNVFLWIYYECQFDIMVASGIFFQLVKRVIKCNLFKSICKSKHSIRKSFLTSSIYPEWLYLYLNKGPDIWISAPFVIILWWARRFWWKIYKIIFLSPLWIFLFERSRKYFKTNVVKWVNF